MKSLNKTQNRIVIIEAIIILACSVFPPWVTTFKAGNAYTENPAGYSFVFEPPKERSRRHGVKLDVSRLVLQIFIISFSTGLGVFAFREQEK